MTWQILKKREDFASDHPYGQFVSQHVQEGMVVRMREDYEVVKVGDLVKVVAKEGLRLIPKLRVAQAERETICFSHCVELLTPSSAVLG